MARNDFLTLKKGEWKIKLKKKYQEILLKLGLEYPNSLFKREEARLLDDSER